MPRTVKEKLTQAKVVKLKCPPNKKYVEKADGVVYGLRLRASRSNLKSYILTFKGTRHVVGHHPEMTLEMARIRAAQARESQNPSKFFGKDKEET